MKCPYCISEISDEALVCPCCARDLYLFKPLLARIDELEQRLANMPDQADLDARLAELELRLASRAETQLGTTANRLEQPHEQNGWIALFMIPLVLLLSAHFLITIVYDLNTIYLRVVSLLIPLPFGFFLMERGRVGVPRVVIATALVALAGVFGMSAVTAMVDKVDLLPRDLREWRELFEYASSIAFSFATGMVLGAMIRLRRFSESRETETGLALRLARILSSSKDNVDKLQALAKRIDNVGGSLTAAATTVASVYAGLHGLVK